jgi:hypothetical protein
VLVREIDSYFSLYFNKETGNDVQLSVKLGNPPHFRLNTVVR